VFPIVPCSLHFTPKAVLSSSRSVMRFSDVNFPPVIRTKLSCPPSTFSTPFFFARETGRTSLFFASPPSRCFLYSVNCVSIPNTPSVFGCSPYGLDINLLCALVTPAYFPFAERDYSRYSSFNPFGVFSVPLVFQVSSTSLPRSPFFRIGGQAVVRLLSLLPPLDAPPPPLKAQIVIPVPPISTHLF